MARSDLTTWILGLTLLTIGIDLGGSFYEGFLIAPLWSQSAPASFALIQPHNGGIELVRFWIPVHGALTLLLLASLALTWKQPAVRRWVWGALGVYLLMRVWTFAYFIPEISAFIATDPASPADAGLQVRAQRWTLLSHGRTLLVWISGYAAFRALLTQVRRS